MRRNTKKRDAFLSAGVHSVLLALIGCSLLWLDHRFDLTAFVRIVVILSAIVDLGCIIPICISCHERIKEIEGGEEDAAAQY